MQPTAAVRRCEHHESLDLVSRERLLACASPPAAWITCQSDSMCRSFTGCAQLCFSKLQPLAASGRCWEPNVTKALQQDEAITPAQHPHQLLGSHENPETSSAAHNLVFHSSCHLLLPGAAGSPTSLSHFNKAKLSPPRSIPTSCLDRMKIKGQILPDSTVFAFSKMLLPAAAKPRRDPCVPIPSCCDGAIAHGQHPDPLLASLASPGVIPLFLLFHFLPPPAAAERRGEPHAPRQSCRQEAIVRALHRRQVLASHARSTFYSKCSAKLGS